MGDYLDGGNTVSDAHVGRPGSPARAPSRRPRCSRVIDFVWPLVDALYIDLPLPTDDRKPKKILLKKGSPD
jgi:type III restriction enzyme